MVENEKGSALERLTEERMLHFHIGHVVSLAPRDPIKSSGYSGYLTGVEADSAGNVEYLLLGTTPKPEQITRAPYRDLVLEHTWIPLPCAVKYDQTGH